MNEKQDSDGRAQARREAGDASDFVIRHSGAIRTAAIVMGVLIVILTAVVAGTIAVRLGGLSSGEVVTDIELPANARLVSASADGDELLLVVEIEGQREIWRVDRHGNAFRAHRIVSQ